MTSEEIHGIVPQPPDSCPLADKAVENTRRALDYLKGYERYDEVSTLHEMCWGAQYHASDIEGDVEKLRAANVAIREWGEQWKQLAKSLFESLENSKFHNSEFGEKP